MKLSTELLINWMDDFAKQIEAKSDYLSELDATIGDGDHGNNMKRGMTAVVEALKGQKNAELPVALRTVAMSLLSKVGGAAGPLYGSAFMMMAQASKATDDLSTLLEKASDGIKHRGQAQAGDKTMVDVWEPLVKFVKDNQLSEDKIQEAVESTRDMIAKRGRASYLGERSKGHLDPGAVSSGYLFASLLKVEGEK